MAEPTVLFVCLHGAAKSVIAASYFQRLAAERGVKVRAVFAGTEPEPEVARHRPPRAATPARHP